MSFWYFQFFQNMNEKNWPNYILWYLKWNYFRSFFGRIEDTKKAFQNKLTFIKTANTSWNCKHLTLKLRSHKCLVPIMFSWGIGFRLIGRQYTSAKHHFHNKNGRNFLCFIFHLEIKFGTCIVRWLNLRRSF